VKKTLVVAIILVVFELNINSQEFTLAFQTGIGSYSMSDLKSINEYITKSLPFDTKTVSDFPAYWYYRPGLLIKSERFTYGVVASFQSTGSRVSGQDYSGEYQFDMKVQSLSPGIYAEYCTKKPVKCKVSVYSILGMSYSHLQMKEYFIVLDTVLVNASYHLSARNYYFEPGLSVSYPVGWFSFGLNAGYCLSFGGKAFTFDENNDGIKLIDPDSHHTIAPDWSGFRIGLSVSFSIKRKSPQ
jgi:hypothetical protein